MTHRLCAECYGRRRLKAWRCRRLVCKTFGNPEYHSSQRQHPSPFAACAALRLVCHDLAQHSPRVFDSIASFILDSISRGRHEAALQLDCALLAVCGTGRQAFSCMAACLLAHFRQLTFVVLGLLSCLCLASAAVIIQIPVPNIQIMSPAGLKSGTSRRWHLSPGWLGVLLFPSRVSRSRRERANRALQVHKYLRSKATSR